MLQQPRHLLGHHPLHPHPRPREPHEEQAAGLVVPLREVALGEHDGVGGLPLEAVDGVSQQRPLAPAGRAGFVVLTCEAALRPEFERLQGGGCEKARPRSVRMRSFEFNKLLPFLHKISAVISLFPYLDLYF